MAAAIKSDWLCEPDVGAQLLLSVFLRVFSIRTCPRTNVSIGTMGSTKCAPTPTVQVVHGESPGPSAISYSCISTDDVRFVWPATKAHYVARRMPVVVVDRWTHDGQVGVRVLKIRTSREMPHDAAAATVRGVMCVGMPVALRSQTKRREKESMSD